MKRSWIFRALFFCLCLIGIKNQLPADDAFDFPPENCTPSLLCTQMPSVCEVKPNCNFYCFDCCLNTSRITISGIAGRGLGHDDRRASLGFFYIEPTDETEWKPFLDVRGHYLSHNRWAANAGAGIRFWDADCERALGANIYYDYRDDCTGNYNQIGVGVESLSLNWDVRFNAYFPVGNRHKAGRARVFNNFVGNFHMICREVGLAFTGANLEAGLPIWQNNCFCNYLCLYGAIGTYYFQCDKFHCRNFKHCWGASARLKVDWSEYFSVEVRATFDEVFHTNVQGIFTLNIPFDVFISACDEPKNCFSCLVAQPVERFDIIVLDRTCCWRSNF